MRQSPFEFGGIKLRLHGSLAFTGIGHATDRASILGLAGFTPANFEAEAAESVLAQIAYTAEVTPPNLHTSNLIRKKIWCLITDQICRGMPMEWF